MIRREDFDGYATNGRGFGDTTFGSPATTAWNGGCLLVLDVRNHRVVYFDE